MSIKSRLFVITFALSLSSGIGCHSAYADFMAPFDEEDGLDTFQSHQDMGYMPEENEAASPFLSSELESIGSPSTFNLQAYEDLTHFNLYSNETEPKLLQYLEDGAKAEQETQQIETLGSPEIYKAYLGNILKDDILAVELAQRSHFDYNKAALAASAAPTSWWGKFLHAIRWDRISSFMEKNKFAAEQGEQIYGK